MPCKTSYFSAEAIALVWCELAKERSDYDSDLLERGKPYAPRHHVITRLLRSYPAGFGRSRSMPTETVCCGGCTMAINGADSA